MWILTKCPLRLVKLDNTRKLGHLLFFTGKFAFFFQKFMFSTTSQVLQKWSNNFESKCQDTFWNLINCLLRFVTLENTRKIGHKIFFTGYFAFFLKFCVFNNLSGPKKSCYKFYSNCQKTFWTLIYCSVKWVNSIIRGKMGHNIFFTGKIAFFSKICVFNNFLGPKKMLL